jgi:lysyl-tRNA synthetase class 1
LLLNLASASNADSKDVMWGFLRRYAPGATPETNPILDRLSEHAIRYFDDFVKPAKKFRAPDDVETAALKSLDATLASLPADADADRIQNALLDVGRAIPRYQDPARKSPSGGPGVKLDWFQAIYEILLGQERGPRLGTFIALYGIPETRDLIGKALSGVLANA